MSDVNNGTNVQNTPVSYLSAPHFQGGPSLVLTVLFLFETNELPPVVYSTVAMIVLQFEDFKIRDAKQTTGYFGKSHVIHYCNSWWKTEKQNHYKKSKI